MNEDIVQYIGSTIDNIRNDMIAFAKDIALKNPNWNPNTDARTSIFYKCTNILGSFNLGLLFIEKYLKSEEWWSENNPNISFHRVLFTEYFYQLIYNGLSIFIFSSIESNFRIFVSTIGNGACNNGRSEFQSVYTYLLKEINLRKYIGLLDIWRNIRNCMHNNGLFYPKNEQDQEIEYNGKKYKFLVGKNPGFADIFFMVESLKHDLMPMMKEVVFSDKIYSLSEIKDLS